jgi:hypothetical protein
LEVARIIATQHYPFLYPLYEREQRKAWFREKYYLRMFSAVAIGCYCPHCLQATGEYDI